MATDGTLTRQFASLKSDDRIGGDDSTDSYESKYWTPAQMFDFMMTQITATLAEINSVCSGNTATAAEISQVCDGRTAGGVSTDDIVTVGASQLLINKGLTSPTLNGGGALTANSTQINTLENVTGNGRVNEVRQGLAVGNANITYTQTTANHGYIPIALTADDDVSLALVSSNYSHSETLMIENISDLYEVTLYGTSGESFWLNSVEYSSVTIDTRHCLTVQAFRSGWSILNLSKGTLNV